MLKSHKIKSSSRTIETYVTSLGIERSAQILPRPGHVADMQMLFGFVGSCALYLLIFLELTGLLSPRYGFDRKELLRMLSTTGVSHKAEPLIPLHLVFPHINLAPLCAAFFSAAFRLSV